MYRSILTNTPGCPTNACRDYKWFDVNAALRYACYPFEYISLQAKTFFSTYSPRRYKPLKHPVDHPKRKKIFRLSIQTGCYLETHQSYSNNLHAPHTTQNGQVIYHSQYGEGISDSFPLNLDGEMLPSHPGIQPEQLKFQSFNFKVFMVFLGHGIGQCLLMVRLGH